MSIMVGVGRGAQAGVLIKNAEALERMEKVDTLVVDKTGTLTEGKPKVVAVAPASGFEESEALRLAASVEQASEHPLAAAIVASARERGLPMSPVSEFDSPTGKGAVGMVDGRRVRLGNAKFLHELGIDTAGLDGEAERLRTDGATAIFLAVDRKLAAVIAIADPVKPTTSEALKLLAQDGVRVVMLTGDNRTTAQAVARRLGIEDVEAEVLPDQKSAVVVKLRQQGRVVAMAGDGVNDAPALAAADVGIAWAPGPMSLSRARASPCSRAISPASSAHAGCQPLPCAISGKICSSPLSTTRRVCPLPPVRSIPCSASCCHL
jgi:Cu+-exporting ATPase